jgi:hypothetical protein
VAVVEDPCIYSSAFCVATFAIVIHSGLLRIRARITTVVAGDPLIQCVLDKSELLNSLAALCDY